MQINETKDPTKAKELKKQRNKVLHNIQKRAMNVAIEKLDSQATELEQMKDSAKMFCAARLMRRKLQPKLIVHDEKGQTIANPVACANRVSQWFNGLFAPADTQGVPICNPGPLDQPISEDEIRSALRRLRNLRATEWMEYQGNC